MTDITYSILTGDKEIDGSIKNMMNQGNLPVEFILTQAQMSIYRRIRVRQMLTTSSGTMGTVARTLTLPTDYLAARHLAITGTNAGLFNRRTLEWIEDRITYNSTGGTSTGKPADYFADGTAIYFAVVPDNLYPYKLWYYAQPAQLSTATETNFLTLTYPTLLIAECMAKANEWMKNAQDRAYWQQIAADEIATANSESASEAQDLDTSVVAM